MPRRSGKTWVNALISLLVVGFFVALCTISIQKPREAAARTQSINNLKNLSLGVHGFHDANKRLPFNGSDRSIDEEKYSAKLQASHVRSGSWGFQVAPYIDSSPIFARPELVWDNGVHCYRCPGRKRTPADRWGPLSDYFINNYLNDPRHADTPDNPDTRVKLVDITDGSANTILFGHGNISTEDYGKRDDVVGSGGVFMGGTFGTARGGPNWRPGQTPSVSLQQDSAEEPDLRGGGWGGPFSSGGLMVMGDATVRLFPYTLSGEVFGAFLTPTGGENVELPD